MKPEIDTMSSRSLVSCIFMLVHRVAIVVVSFNTRELLLECLSSATRHAPEADIILVDNASVDGSVVAARHEFPAIRIIENHQNLGFAAACNQAIRSVDSDFFLLLNSDAVLTEGAVSGLLQSMTANPRAGAAGCLIVDAAGSPCVTAMKFLTPWNQALELLGIKIPGLRRKLSPVCMEPGDYFVDWIEGSCLMLRRLALDEIGLLDEQFFMYSEDEDICWRLRRAGWQLCYTTKATVSHIGGASASADRPANLERFYSSQIQLLRKHRGKSQSRLFVILTGIALRSKLLRSTARSDHKGASEWRSRLIALKAARTSSTVRASSGEGP